MPYQLPACCQRLSTGISYLGKYILWPFIKGNFSLQNGSYLQWFNTFTFFFFLGIRNCNLFNSMRNEDDSMSHIFIATLCSLALLPAAIGQFWRYYDLLTQYFDKTKAPAIWSWVGKSTWIIQSSMAALVGYNAATNVFLPREESGKCSIGLNKHDANWYQFLGNSIFGIILGLSALKHESILFTGNNILQRINLPLTAVLFSTGNFMADSFASIHTLIQNSKSPEGLRPLDYVEIGLLIIALLILIPYRSISFLEEYYRKLNMRPPQTEEDIPKSKGPWAAVKRTLWKFWKEHIKPSQTMAAVVTIAVWYVCIRNLIHIFQNLHLAPKEVAYSFSISTGAMAALVFFLRFRLLMSKSTTLVPNRDGDVSATHPLLKVPSDDEDDV